MGRLQQSSNISRGIVGGIDGGEFCTHSTHFSMSSVPDNFMATLVFDSCQEKGMLAAAVLLEILTKRSRQHVFCNTQNKKRIVTYIP